jgi:hypothetical protein
MKVRMLLAVVVVFFGANGITSGAQLQYSTPLSGAAESPSNSSPGTGSALITVDTDASTLRVETTFSGLEGTVTAAHIHCCTVDPGVLNAGVATIVPTFPGFPAGVTSGTYDMTFDLTQDASYNPAFLAANGGNASGAMSALLAGLEQTRAYLNIHTSAYNGGEIRGFPVVPEPSSFGLLLTGACVVAICRRRRKS